VVADPLDRVCLAPLDLATDLVGAVEQVDAGAVILIGFAHLGGAVL
jgi:hypothetical protein